MPNLENIAVYEGDPNTILSLVADTRIVKWQVIPTSDEFGTYTIQDYGGNRDPTLSGLYYTNNSGVVVLDATTIPNGADPISTSGLYLADCESNGNRGGAKLVVVREYFHEMKSCAKQFYLNCRFQCA